MQASNAAPDNDFRFTPTLNPDIIHPAQGARSIVAAEGVAGLYQGLLPTLLRDVPDIAIQFALYERLRKVLERRRQVSKLRTWEHLILGGVSGGHFCHL